MRDTVASGCSWCIHVVEYKNCLMLSLLFHYFMDILELHVLDLIKWVVLVLLMDPLVASPISHMDAYICML